MLKDQSTQAPSAGLADDFSQVVADEALGRASDEAAAMLRRPPNLDEWRDTLVGLMQQTEVEFSKRRAELNEMRDPSRYSHTEFRDAEREHARWASRTNHFLACLKARLLEAKRLQRKRDDARHHQTITQLTTRIDELEVEVAHLWRIATARAKEVGS